jgi:hypothetical protein
MAKLNGKVALVVIETLCHEGVWLDAFLTSTVDGGK